MAFSDELNRLEQLIVSAMGDAVDSARRRVADEVRRHGTGLRESAREQGLEALVGALSRLDASRGQGEVLAALLEEAGRHASRTALLLTFADGARGWGGFGFGPEGASIEALRLGYDAEPWARIAAGRGCVRLADGEAAALADRLGAAAPAEAVFVPIVLRDRVGAVLYADRLQEGDPLSLKALQILAFVAGNLLELVTVRSRGAAPTLVEDRGTGEGLPLWSPDARPQAAAPAEAVADVATEEAEASVEDSRSDEAAAPAPTAEIPSWQVPPVPPEEEAPGTADELGDAGDETEQPPPPAEIAAAAETGADLWEEEALEVPPEIPAYEEAEPPGVPAPESAAGEEMAASEEIGFAVEEEEEEPFSEEPTESLAGPLVAGAAPERTAEERSSDEPVTADDDIFAAEEEPERAAETPPDEDRTVLLDRSQLGIAPPPVAPPPAPPPERTAPIATATPLAGGGGSTEVRPPDDLEGPGWAFRDEPSAPPEFADEETASLHDEAKRLARLLVSEIKLYNEEQVEEGRRSRDLYRRLQEDIDRSRQMYQERVDPRVHQETDYFQQEIVNILAGGDAGVLGT